MKSPTHNNLTTSLRRTLSPVCQQHGKRCNKCRKHSWKITLEGLKSPTHNNISQLQKLNLALFGQKLFLVFGPFQAVALAQSLSYRRSTTTGSGRLYGVGRIILVCNAYAVTIFWLYFLVFARCIFLRFGLYDGIGSLCVTREKLIWLFLANKLFSVFGLFHAVVFAQSLRYCQVQIYG